MWVVGKEPGKELKGPANVYLDVINQNRQKRHVFEFNLQSSLYDLPATLEQLRDQAPALALEFDTATSPHQYLFERFGYIRNFLLEDKEGSYSALRDIADLCMYAQVRVSEEGEALAEHIALNIVQPNSRARQLKEQLEVWLLDFQRLFKSLIRTL